MPELKSRIVSWEDITDISDITNALAVGVLDRRDPNSSNLLLVDHMPSRGISKAQLEIDTAHVSFFDQLQIFQRLILLTLNKQINDDKKRALMARLWKLASAGRLRSRKATGHVHFDYALPVSPEKITYPLGPEDADLQPPKVTYDEAHERLNQAMINRNFIDGTSSVRTISHDDKTGYIVRGQEIYMGDLGREGEKLHHTGSSGLGGVKVVTNPNDHPIVTGWDGGPNGKPLLKVARLVTDKKHRN